MHRLYNGKSLACLHSGKKASVAGGTRQDKMSMREAQRGPTLQGHKESHRELVEFLFFQALKSLSRAMTSLGRFIFQDHILEGWASMKAKHQMGRHCKSPGGKGC